MFWAGVSSGILAVSLTAFVFLLIKISAHPFFSSRKALPAILALALLFCFLLVCYAGAFSSGTLYELGQILHGNFDDSFGSHRIQIWKGVLEIIKKHPWLGIGPGTLEDNIDIRFERWSELLEQTLSTYVDDAHNIYLQYLVSFGILGCLPLAALAAVLLKRLFAKMQGGAELSNALRIMLPAAFCYLIQAFFNLDSCIISPLFIILISLIAADAAQ
jgi:O-antigen ligase